MAMDYDDAERRLNTCKAQKSRAELDVHRLKGELARIKKELVEAEARLTANAMGVNYFMGLIEGMTDCGH